MRWLKGLSTNQVARVGTVSMRAQPEVCHDRALCEICLLDK